MTEIFWFALVPPNADLVRNLMFCSHYLQDHIVHFYILHALDWVDVVSALKADPAETSRIAQSISNWPRSSPNYFRDIQKKIKTLVDSGQLGIFANAYWGHPAYRLPPEVNLLGVAHYLETLEWQKEIVKVHAIFGGKNPHPHYLVGGAPCAVDPENAMALNAERLALVGKLFDDALRFVEQVYIPDLLAVASFYKDWASIGGGLRNYLAYGDLPTKGYDDPSSFLFPRGAILDRNLNEVLEIDGTDPEQIQENVAHSWYTYQGGDEKFLHPWEGETELNYTGPQPPYQHLNVEEKYSWLKTPRWKGHAMEVGPLARMLVGYAAGQEEIRDVIDSALAEIVYSFMYLAIVFQIFTGFALYSLMSAGFFPKLFSWVIPLMGGIAVVKHWHHLFMWVFVTFTILHIYLSWYHDYLEGRGTISSMIGGWKFIEKTPEMQIK